MTSTEKIKECAAGPTGEDKMEPKLLALGGKYLNTCGCARGRRERSLFVSACGNESCVQNLRRASAATEGARVLLNVLKPQPVTKIHGNCATMTTACITGGSRTDLRMVAKKITEARMSGVTRDRNLVPPRLQPFRWHPSLTCQFFAKLTHFCAHIILNAHASNCLTRQELVIMCMTNCENESRPHGNRHPRQGQQSVVKRTCKPNT